MLLYRCISIFLVGILMKNFVQSVRRKLTQIAKKNIKYRRFIRWSMNTYRLLRYKIETFGNRVNDKIIIFSSFNGRNYSCSPKAIYEYMVQDPRFEDYTFVWAFKDIKKYKPYFTDRPNTIIVKQGGKKYRKFVSKAKYWIFNFKVDDFLKPKKNQIFVQCWHGTPLKMLGCDLKHLDNALNTTSGMKKRYHIESEKFDYFISPSKFASDRFRSAWDLEAVGKSDIMIEQGYPRNDELFHFSEQDVDQIKKDLFGYYYLEYEKDIKKKKIILYAPTFRANQHQSGLGYVYDTPIDLDYMYDRLSDEYIILFRAHYFICNQFDFDKYAGFVYDVSKYDNINKLYMITDILVTDYSSVFFDYANLKRPMIFYMYDLEYYRDKSNGFYIDVEEELPGKIVRNDKQLVEEIRRVTTDFKYDEKYKRFNDKYNYLDDGNATERVVNTIFADVL